MTGARPPTPEEFAQFKAEDAAKKTEKGAATQKAIAAAQAAGLCYCVNDDGSVTTWQPKRVYS